jgi:hypothetical protein
MEKARWTRGFTWFRPPERNTLRLRRELLYYCMCVVQAWSSTCWNLSCRPMMALTSGVLETCVHASVMRIPSYIGRPARVFFMLVTRGPQGTAGRVAAPEPSPAGTGSGAMVHVAAPEPSLAGRWGPKPLDTWRPRSPPWQGARVRYRMARGSVWMLTPLSVLT